MSAAGTPNRVRNRRVRELPPELVNGIACSIGTCTGESTHVIAWEQAATEREMGMWPHAPKRTTRRKRACGPCAREYAEKHGLELEEA